MGDECSLREEGEFSKLISVFCQSLFLSDFLFLPHLRDSEFPAAWGGVGVEIKMNEVSRFYSPFYL